MAESASTDNPIKQNIILDTCILQYLGDRHISLELNTYLLDLISRGFDFAISDISIQELLTGTTIKQEQVGLKLLNGLVRYSIFHNILVAAAQLTTLYRQDKVKNEHISIPDKIIASTAILNGALVLTADVHDFPRPFFSEAEEKLIIYRKKDKSNILCLQILKPNIDYINQRFSERPKG